MISKFIGELSYQDMLHRTISDLIGDFKKQMSTMEFNTVTITGDEYFISDIAAWCESMGMKVSYSNNKSSIGVSI